MWNAVLLFSCPEDPHQIECTGEVPATELISVVPKIGLTIENAPL